MPQILKNKNVEILVDLPNEGYQLSRFDWTGKITTVKFKDMMVSGVERTDVSNAIDFGKGFYNEFGITNPVGFEETKIGGWFHKIGVGLLKKSDDKYGFHKKYEIEPGSFATDIKKESVQLTCTSEVMNGYGYQLIKIIKLLNDGFVIYYKLENTGTKTIETDEYNHNFLSLDWDIIGKNYKLKFPFILNSLKFDEKLNEEEKVMILGREISFTGTPKEQFFFSNINGSERLKAGWELINHEKKLIIQEIVDFKTNKVNLWGWTHVISPEIFFKINLKPNQTTEWSRTYKINNTI